jgi:hypothetical protein
MFNEVKHIPDDDDDDDDDDDHMKCQNMSCI